MIVFAIAAISVFLQFATLPAVASAPSSPAGLVSKIPGDRREFEIVSTEFADERSSATVTFASATGIFAFNLNLSAAKLTSLNLVVQKQKFCEGLAFRGKDGAEIDLRTTKGVKISEKKGDIVIEFTAVAIEALKPGGWVQFINQYR